MANVLWIGNQCIYTDTVNDLVSTCETALEDAGLDTSDLQDEIESTIKGYSMEDFLENPTNAIISAALNATESMLNQKFQKLGISAEVSSYTNGDDSGLYINSEKYYANDETIKDLIRIRELTDDYGLDNDEYAWDFDDKGNAVIDISLSEDGMKIFIDEEIRGWDEADKALENIDTDKAVQEGTPTVSLILKQDETLEYRLSVQDNEGSPVTVTVPSERSTEFYEVAMNFIKLNAFDDALKDFKQDKKLSKSHAADDYLR